MENSGDDAFFLALLLLALAVITGVVLGGALILATPPAKPWTPARVVGITPGTGGAWARLPGAAFRTADGRRVYATFSSGDPLSYLLVVGDAVQVRVDGDQADAVKFRGECSGC